MGITLHLKRGDKMKKLKLVLLAFLMVMSFGSASFAVDWSQYESIRDNVRLEGYQSMPGYMAFGDGDGNILGYVWMSPGKGLVWCSATTGTSYKPSDTANPYNTGTGIINLRTTQLTDDYGIPVATEFTGTIADGVIY